MMIDGGWVVDEDKGVDADGDVGMVVESMEMVDDGGGCSDGDTGVVVVGVIEGDTSKEGEEAQVE